MEKNLEYIKVVNGLQSDWETFIRNYEDFSNVENDDISNMEDIEPVKDEFIEYKQDYEEPLQLFESPMESPKLHSTRRKGKSLNNIGRNVQNYRNLAKNINNRDILRLAQKSINSSKELTKEANWLHHMRGEVARTSYEFAKKY